MWPAREGEGIFLTRARVVFDFFSFFFPFFFVFNRLAKTLFELVSLVPRSHRGVAHTCMLLRVSTMLSRVRASLDLSVIHPKYSCMHIHKAKILSDVYFENDIHACCNDACVEKIHFILYSFTITRHRREAEGDAAHVIR